MAKKKKKSIWKSTFYRVYFALVGVALVGIAIGCVWLRGVLRDYESAQPSHVAEDVAALFENGDYAAIYSVDTTAAEQVGEEDRDFYIQSLRELSEGRDVEWSEAFSSDPDRVNYNLTLDGERFASFSLVPSGQTTARGNRLWTLDSVTTNVELRQPEPTPEPTPEAPVVTYSCRVTAPEGYAVLVDGAPLTEENAQVTPHGLFEDGFLPDTVANPTVLDYVFESDTETPAITATDETGAAAAVYTDGEKQRTWNCPRKGDESFQAQYGQAALALGKQVAKFISRDAGKGSLQNFCAKNSPAAEIFKNLSNTFTTPHEGYSFDNEVVSQFYALSEDCFTCHVTFDYVLNTKNGKRPVPTAYTFCLVRKGDEARLYNMLSY